MGLTKEHASTLSVVAAGAGVAALVAGAVLVEPVVIGAGVIGAAIAALVKLNTSRAESFPQATSANHPMRRADDQKGEPLGMGH